MKRLRPGADHSPPSTAVVKNERSSISTLSYAFMASTGTTCLVVPRRSILGENIGVVRLVPLLVAWIFRKKTISVPDLPAPMVLSLLQLLVVHLMDN